MTLVRDSFRPAAAQVPHYRRDKPEDWSPRNFEQCPYLRGLPEMPDDIAELAGQRRLTPQQEALIDQHVRRISRAVREARERWEAEQPQDVLADAEWEDDESFWDAD